MRVEKREVIFISQKEADTWNDFDQFLEEIKRKSESPDIKDLVLEIQSCLGALWDGIEDVDIKGL